MQLETVKIKSPLSDDNDTGYIVINKSDFVDGTHELFVEGEQGTTKKADLTVEQIKTALAVKQIDIPAGTTKKADLQGLLDKSNAAV